MLRCATSLVIALSMLLTYLFAADIDGEQYESSEIEVTYIPYGVDAPSRHASTAGPGEKNSAGVSDRTSPASYTTHISLDVPFVTPTVAAYVTVPPAILSLPLLAPISYISGPRMCCPETRGPPPLHIPPLPVGLRAPPAA